MINITDSPIALLKYHIKQTTKDKKIFLTSTSSLQELKDCLLHSVAYEGVELLPVLYIIVYTGKAIPDNLLQAENNTAYIRVDKPSNWKSKFKKDKNVQVINIDPSIYQHELKVLNFILTPKAYQYYWEYYCLERFKSSPIKWYNEVKYLTFLYKEKGEKFTCEDLDLIYNKVSDIVKPYLQNVFTSKGKEYILQMSNKEKFVVFIGVRKSLIESIILKQDPESMMAYLIFREAFDSASIRLDEGIVILDFILNNKETKRSIKQIRNLFGLL